MAKSKRPERVKVVADSRTKGAAPGAVANPLKSELAKWEAKGWNPESPTAEPTEPKGE